MIINPITNMISVCLLIALSILPANCVLLESNLQLTSNQIFDQLQHQVIPKLANVTLNLPLTSSQLTLSTLLQRYSKAIARHLEDDSTKGQPQLSLSSLNSEKKKPSEECLSHLVYITNSLIGKSMTENATWLINLIDSYGKIGSGLLRGNIHWEGDYWQCLAVDVPTVNISDHVYGGFKGRYCTAKWNLKVNSSRLPPFQLTSGICVPDSCRQSDLTIEIARLKGLVKYLPLVRKVKDLVSLGEVYCPEHRQLGIDGVLCIIVVSFFVTSCLIATLIDLWTQEDDNDDDCHNKEGIRIIAVAPPLPSALLLPAEENHHGSSSSPVIKDNEICDEIVCDDGLTTADDNGLLVGDQVPLTRDETIESKETRLFEKTLQCFSFYANWCKLTNTESRKYELGAFHGIRFLSMVWIIIGHTYVFSLNVLRNVLDVLDSIDNLPFYTILNGSLSVDSFFTISGFLVSYLFFLEHSERKSFNIIYFYLHRYWRLIPVYAMLAWIYSSLGDNISSGPYWDYGDLDGSSFGVCRQNWWYNLLLINNWIDFKDQCLSYTWYLANDFQFYLISPVFLFTLGWKKWLGLALCGLAVIGSGITTFVISYQNNFPIYFGSHGTLVDSMGKNQSEIMQEALDYMNKVYDKPYCRIGPYIIGIIAGYLLVQYIKHNYPLKKSWIKLGYLLAATLCLTSLYATYHSNMTRLQLAFHQSSFRVLWAIGLSIIILICSTVNNSLVNKLLSYPLWIPLSRLTYCAYLVHPIVLIIYYTSFKSSLEFSHALLMSISGAALLFVYLLALLASFLVEMPFLNLEKLFFRKMKKV